MTGETLLSHIGMAIRIKHCLQYQKREQIEYVIHYVASIKAATKKNNNHEAHGPHKGVPIHFKIPLPERKGDQERGYFMAGPRPSYRIE